MNNKLILGFLAFWLWSTCAYAAPLFAISSDDNGIARRVSFIDTDTATAMQLFDLGDGSQNFTGLTFVNNQFYTIASDFTGSSTLYSFTLGGGGTTIPLFSLGTGFTGGIAAQSNKQLYALANDASGASMLYAIDISQSSASLIDPALGFGFAGGVTWNVDTGLLYAPGTDFRFAQSLFSIDPTTPGSASTASDMLGFGINGGVDYASGDGYFAIGSEPFFSELLSVSVGGDKNPLFPLARFQSFTFSALTSGPDITVTRIPTPEPPIPWLMLPLLWLLAWRSFSKKSSRRLAIRRHKKSGQRVS